MAPRKPDPARVHLGKAERKTHVALYRTPPPIDLTWGEVITLLERLAEVREDRKGRFLVTRHGVLTTLRAPLRRVAMTADELLEVRSFLERSEDGRIAPVVAEGTRVLVAVDAGGAHLFRLEFKRGRPSGLTPFESNGYGAHLRTTLGPSARPEPRRLGFAKDLARALRGAEEFVLVAAGPTAEADLALLRAELRRADARIHDALAACLVTTARSLGEAQLLERARTFYAER